MEYGNGNGNGQYQSMEGYGNGNGSVQYQSMEGYGNGNGNGQYQSMEGYGMSAPDGQCPEIGQDYDQSRCYGNGSQSYDDSRNYQSGSASLGGPGYRSPLRYNKVLREMNSRNGLYSPMDRSGSGRGNGDFYNSLPGLGGYEGQMYQSRNSSNPGNSYY